MGAGWPTEAGSRGRRGPSAFDMPVANSHDSANLRASRSRQANRSLCANHTNVKPAVAARTALAIAIGALILSIASVGWRAPVRAAEPARFRASDPAFTGLRFATNSDHFRFDRYRGKVLYINFFASWCPPCNREAPTLAELARTYASRGLVVIGIDEGEDAAHALGFRKRYDLPYPVVLDPESRAESPFGETGLPMHVFFDRSGGVATTQLGPLDATTAASTIDLLLGETST